MEDAQIVAIAEAVKGTIHAAPLSLPTVECRSYLPTFNLEEMAKARVTGDKTRFLGEIHVTVVAAARRIDFASRGSAQNDIDIHVSVQKHLKEVAACEIDPLILLVEEIGDLFFVNQGKTPLLLPDPANAACVGLSNEPIYIPEHLEQWRQFTSVLMLTFRKVR